MRAPSRGRRGVHALVSVAMLTGFSLAMAGLLFVFLSERADTAAEGAGCMVYGVSLHSTSGSTAYLSVHVRNTGSGELVSVAAYVADDAGAEHALRSGSVAVPPGGSWHDKGPLPAGVTYGNPYVVRAEAAYEGGSRSVCVAGVTAR